MIEEKVKRWYKAPIRSKSGSHETLLFRLTNVIFFPFQVLLQQQQVQIDEAVTRAQNDALVKQADDSKISLSDFDAKLQPIIDSCTKDSISNGE